VVGLHVAIRDPIGLQVGALLGLVAAHLGVQEWDRAHLTGGEAPALGTDEVLAADSPAVPRACDRAELALDAQIDDQLQPAPDPPTPLPALGGGQVYASEGREQLRGYTVERVRARVHLPSCIGHQSRGLRHRRSLRRDLP
jgi:hypothetical protein